MKLSFDHITDEHLAQFIDGAIPPDETDAILDSIQSCEDLETVALASSAKAMVEDDDADDLPEWDIKPGKKITMYPFNPLPACGFLGNEEPDGEDPGHGKKK